jgi:2-keto-4-pentenoate hydratase/2-oxohepta-3-ene-1,7-dioic acid hydratase in catechol pathway
MSEYKLGTGMISGQPTPIVWHADRVYTLEEVIGPAAPCRLEDVFASWTNYESLIAERVDAIRASGRDPSATQYLTPLAYPRKLICIGTNYRDHLEEMKVSELPRYPYAFLRAQTSLAAHGEEIKLPDGTKMVDWEAELGIIIGRTYGPRETNEPVSAVAGYTVINDVSARDWIASRPMVGIDWVMQKSWDKFQPTGPWITPARYVENPQNLLIELRVNGEIKQRSNTSLMIFGVRDIVRHLASMMTLEPGDVIATGTPAGVGFGRQPPEFIKSGDRVEVTIQGLGSLSNQFV